MKVRPWFMPAVLTVVALLLIAQVIQGVIIYTASQENAQRFNALETSDNAIQQNIDVARSQLGADIVNTKTELGERILDLETRLQSTEETFAAQLALLEQSQENTRSQLESSIRNIQLNNQDFSGTIQDVLPSVVSVLTDEGQGSGVIVTTDGLVMTNYHVIEDASIIRVLAYDGKVHAVDVIGFAETRDIAILKIRTAQPFERLRFATDAFVGQNVVAIGNPGGLGFTVTEGIVSNTNRVIDGQSFIQISAPINPGNSGGPLINIDGDIIGINTLKLGGFEGVGFAIPAEDAKDILDQALTHLNTT